MGPGPAAPWQTPWVPFLYLTPRPWQVVGIVCLGPPGSKVEKRAGDYWSSGAVARSAFFLAGPIPSVSRLHDGWLQLYALWDNFYFGARFAEAVVGPLEKMRMLVVAFNADSRSRTEIAAPEGRLVPFEQRGKLSFSLQPGTWTASELEFEGPHKAGGHLLRIQSSSGGDRFAKGAALSMATLGLVIHSPGYREVRIPFEVIPLEQLKQVRYYTNVLLADVAQMAASRGYTQVIIPGQAPVPLEQMLLLLRQYATAQRWADALRSYRDRAATQLFLEFMADQFDPEARLA